MWNLKHLVFAATIICGGCSEGEPVYAVGSLDSLGNEEHISLVGCVVYDSSDDSVVFAKYCSDTFMEESTVWLFSSKSTVEARKETFATLAGKVCVVHGLYVTENILGRPIIVDPSVRWCFDIDRAPDYPSTDQSGDKRIQ